MTRPPRAGCWTAGWPAVHSVLALAVLCGRMIETDSRYDAVILWTNGSDPLLYHEEDHLRGAFGNRDREWGELATSVKLLHRNAKHLGAIYVVTPKGVRPTWLGSMPSAVKSLLIFVDQSDILPPKFANTTNSVTIQWYLHNLRKWWPLSDPYIMMNDDWMVTRVFDLEQYVTSNVWYEDTFGKSWGTDPFLTGTADDGNRQFRGSIGAANRALKKQFTEHVPRNVIGHVPAVVRNQTLTFIHDHFDLESSMTMKRDNDNLQFEYMLANTERQLLPGVSFKAANQVSLFIQMNGPIEQLAARLEWVLRNPRTFVCINDDIKVQYLASDANIKEFKKLIGRFMKRMFFMKTPAGTATMDPTHDCNASTLLLFGVFQKGRIGIFKTVGLNHGRPIYKRQTDNINDNDQYMYYWPSYQSWRVGNTQDSPIAGLTSRNGEAALCPQAATRWEQHTGAGWKLAPDLAITEV